MSSRDGRALPTLPHTYQHGHASQKTPHKPPSLPSTSTGSAPAASRQKPGLPVASAEVVPMSPHAATNNEKLFPTFKANLADVKYGGTYASSAEKLAGWLSKDKAYYESARPWIVDLLEQAQKTIRQVCAGNLPKDQPFHVFLCPVAAQYWVAPYIKLVRAVEPFDHLFIEPALRERLDAIYRTVGSPNGNQVPLHAPQPSPFVQSSHHRPTSATALPSPFTPSPSTYLLTKPANFASAAPVASPSPTVAIPVSMNMNVGSKAPPGAPVAVSPAATTPATSRPPSATAPWQQTSFVPRPGSRASISAGPSRAPSSAMSAPPARNFSSPASSVASTSAAPHSNPSASAPAKRKSISSKNLSLLINDFLEDDIEDFKQQKMKAKEAEADKEKLASAVAESPVKSNEDQKEKTPVPTMVPATAETSKDPVGVGATRTDSASPALKPSDGMATTKLADAEATASVPEPSAVDPPDQATADAMAVDREPSPVPGRVDATEVSIANASEATAAPAVANASSEDVPIPTGAPAPSVASPEASASPRPPHADVRHVDLAKMKTPARTKTKKASSDFIISRVTRSPEVSTTPVTGTSTLVAPSSPLPMSAAVNSSMAAQSAPSSASSTSAPSHKVKSKSKKGPPGIKASELPQQPTSTSSARATPPSISTSDSPQPSALSRPAEDAASQEVGLGEQPVVTSASTPPSVSTSGPAPQESSVPPSTPAPIVALTGADQAELGRMDVELPALVSFPTGLPVGGSASRGASPEPARMDPVPAGQEGSVPMLVDSPLPIVTEVAQEPAAQPMNVDGDSEDEEPLSARLTRIRDASPALKRPRSRSGTPFSANQRRRTLDAIQTAPVASSSKASSGRTPLAVRGHARDYSADVFNGGTFVYSPVQPTAPCNAAVPSRSATPVSAPAGEMTADNSLGPKLLPPSLSRASLDGEPRWGTVKWTARLSSSSKPDSLPVYTDAEIDKMPVFSDDARVLTFSRGQRPSETKPLLLSFHLSSEVFEACARWANRLSEDSDLSDVKCLSLVCYNFSDCAERIGPNMSPNDLVFVGRPVAWPLLSYPYINFNKGTSRLENVHLTVLHLDKDHLFDISGRVHSGQNVIEISRGQPHMGTQDYVYVVCLHKPTPRQSSIAHNVREKARLWDDTMCKWGLIDIPPMNVTAYV